MAALIFLSFIIVPLIEIGIFVLIGDEIGLWNTLAIVVLTAFIGTGMLRAQGLRTLQRAQESLARQEFPVAEVFDGLCLLVGGALLLTPGFLTDALGFLLFLPPVRTAIRKIAWRHLSASGTTWVDGGADVPGASQGGRRQGSAPTLEGEYREVPPDRRDGGDDAP
ncbi:MAG: FxsA family protein [Rhodospirillales bacterium]|nr:FxsA family protein [Rhodospirillales bacterium]